MGDGFSNGPYRPITDTDVLTDRAVGGILDTLAPPYGDRLARHMMARERKLGMELRAALAKLKRYEERELCGDCRDKVPAGECPRCHGQRSHR